MKKTETYFGPRLSTTKAEANEQIAAIDEILAKLEFDLMPYPKKLLMRARRLFRRSPK